MLEKKLMQKKTALNSFMGTRVRLEFLLAAFCKFDSWKLLSSGSRMPRNRGEIRRHLSHIHSSSHMPLKRSPDRRIPLRFVVERERGLESLNSFRGKGFGEMQRFEADFKSQLHNAK